MWPHDLKLQRASKHLDGLEAEIDQWAERGGYTIQVEPDPQPRECEYVVKAYIHEPLREDPFSLLMGDFLQNARAALDYLAHALGDAGAGGFMEEQDARNSGFPIIGDADGEGYTGRGPDRFAEAAKTKLATVAGPARAVIESLQPYYVGGQVWNSEPLWILHELARYDRHRFLHPAVLFTGDTRLDPARGRNVRIREMASEFGGLVLDPPEPGEENGAPSAELARFVAKPASPRKEMHLHFLADLQPGFHVDALPSSLFPALEDTPIVTTLASVRRGVRQAISRLSPFLPPQPPPW